MAVETWLDFLARQFLTPTMGGTESSAMPFVANRVLYLADAPFVISGKNCGGGVSGGGSGKCDGAGGVVVGGLERGE